MPTRFLMALRHKGREVNLMVTLEDGVFQASVVDANNEPIGEGIGLELDEIGLNAKIQTEGIWATISLSEVK